MKVITWIKSWNNEQERKWKWLNNMQRNLCSLHVTPNLLLKSTKKFLSGLFLLLFVKPPHSSTMHSIGESLVQKKCALDRCKDFNGLSDSIRPEPSLSTSFLFDEGVQQWGRLYSWGVASSISPSVGEDAGSLMCKAFWLSNTLKGCCHQWICTKLTFFQRLWLKQVSAAGQQRKLKPWTGLQRFTSKRVACFSAPAIQKVDTTMTCIGSTIQPTTASSLKNQHTERKSEATDRFALCTRKQINLDRFGGEGIWMYLGIFFLHILESQTSCRGIVWCLEEIDVHSIPTGCLTSPWANEWNTIVGHWEDIRHDRWETWQPKGDHSTSTSSIEASTAKLDPSSLRPFLFRMDWMQNRVGRQLGGWIKSDRKKLWSEIWHTEIRPDGKLKLEHTDGTGVLKVGTIQTLQHCVQHGVTMENCSMLQNKITLFDVASSYF